MLHNIIVVGAKDKVDALIAKFRNDTSMQESSHSTDQLSSLGFREFYFEQNGDRFTFRHISTKEILTKENKTEFLHLMQINQQLSLANLCITCDIAPSTIEFLSLANQHKIGFISNTDEINIIEEIKNKSSAKDQTSLALETDDLSKFVKKPYSVKAAVTLFAKKTEIALSPLPVVPNVNESISDCHL